MPRMIDTGVDELLSMALGNMIPLAQQAGEGPRQAHLENQMRTQALVDRANKRRAELAQLAMEQEQSQRQYELQKDTLDLQRRREARYAREAQQQQEMEEQEAAWRRMTDVAGGMRNLFDDFMDYRKDSATMANQRSLREWREHRIQQSRTEEEREKSRRDATITNLIDHGAIREDQVEAAMQLSSGELDNFLAEQLEAQQEQQAMERRFAAGMDELEAMEVDQRTKMEYQNRIRAGEKVSEVLSDLKRRNDPKAGKIPIPGRASSATVPSEFMGYGRSFGELEESTAEYFLEEAKRSIVGEFEGLDSERYEYTEQDVLNGAAPPEVEAAYAQWRERVKEAARMLSQWAGWVQ